MDFSNKVVAITGGASGIGWETAKLMTKLGGFVFISDIKDGVAKQKVDELNLQLGDKDAEILVLHGSISDLKRRADALLAQVREVSAQLPAVSPDRLKAMLEKVDSDLAGIVE